VLKFANPTTGTNGTEAQLPSQGYDGVYRMLEWRHGELVGNIGRGLVCFGTCVLTLDSSGYNGGLYCYTCTI
jgi:hypothetical protein